MSGSKPDGWTILNLIVPVLYSVIILLGIIGNTCVICVIMRTRKLRTPTNFLLLNLAVSDVAFLLICGGFTIIQHVLMHWPLGSVLCRLIQYLLYVSCYVTVYTLMTVSVIRYVSVVRRESTLFLLRLKSIKVIVLCIWILFLLMKTPILVVHGVSSNPVSHRVECIITGVLEGQQLVASFFTFAFMLPLLVIATLYVRIIAFLRTTGSLDILRRERKQGHVIKVATLLVVTFAVCWLPLHLHLLADYYGLYGNDDPMFQRILLITCYSLAFINSMLNPVIYNFFSTDFRKAFKKLVPCLR